MADNPDNPRVVKLRYKSTLTSKGRIKTKNRLRLSKIKLR